MDKNTIKNYYEKKIFYVQMEFIKDFLFSLLDKVDRTYLGDDIMKEENKKEHFEWCLNEIIKNFERENIIIHNTPNLNKNLLEVFNKYYYSVKKSKNTLDNFKIRLGNLNLLPGKTGSQIEEIVWYHKLFYSNIGYIIN